MATSVGRWAVTLGSVGFLGFVSGCSGVGTVGLANAPAYGGDSPETRVHDVIASGHDSCERSLFPQGDVLRGHVPSCVAGDGMTEVTLLPEPRAATVKVVPWHGFGVCVDPGSGRTRAEEDPAGISAVAPATVVCSR